MLGYFLLVVQISLALSLNLFNLSFFSNLLYAIPIISSKSEEIKKLIIENLGHGVTTYKGKSGYGKQGESGQVEIVYTIVTRLELNRLKSEIEKVDENAFVIISSVHDTKGGMVQKRGLKY